MPNYQLFEFELPTKMYIECIHKRNTNYHQNMACIVPLNNANVVFAMCISTWLSIWIVDAMFL